MNVRAALLLSLFFSAAAYAIDLNPIPSENAKEIGSALSAQAAKVEKLPVKVTADLENIKGLISDDQQQGVMVIPAKDLKEDRENPALTKDKGLPIGTLYFYNILPGELKDKKKLFEAKYTDDTGATREVRFGVLTVFKASDDEYKLQLWGADDKPIAEGNFSEDQSDSKAPLDLDTDGNDLEITLLGKYPASIPVKASPF